jgi:hypothetical protein
MTSIDLLIEELKSKCFLSKIHNDDLDLIINKAKKNHKIEISRAYNQGNSDALELDLELDFKKEKLTNATIYYNQTFNIKKNKNANRTTVIDILTNKEYSSLKEASIDLDIDYQNLINSFRKGRINKTSLRKK